MARENAHASARVSEQTVELSHVLKVWLLFVLVLIQGSPVISVWSRVEGCTWTSVWAAGFVDRAAWSLWETLMPRVTLPQEERSQSECWSTSGRQGRCWLWWLTGGLFSGLRHYFGVCRGPRERRLQGKLGALHSLCCENQPSSDSAPGPRDSGRDVGRGRRVVLAPCREDRGQGQRVLCDLVV